MKSITTTEKIENSINMLGTKKRIKEIELYIQTIRNVLYYEIENFIRNYGYNNTVKDYKISPDIINRIYKSENTIKIETLLKVYKKLFDKKL